MSEEKKILIDDLPIGKVVWHKKSILGITGITLPKKYYDMYCVPVEGNDTDFELCD